MDININQVIENEEPVSGLEPYMKEFATDRLVDLKLISDLIKEEEYSQIAKIAHKWKGFSEPYGFNYLAELARKLEESCKKKDSLKIKQFFSDISNYLSIKNIHINKKY